MTNSAQLPEDFVVTKFCRLEHNIARNCKTIRVGTFDYYRQMEDEELGDPYEAIARLHAAEAQEVVIGGRSGSLDPGTPITVIRPNSFLFCVSEMGDDTVSDYVDWYHVTDWSNFGTTLCNHLWLQVPLDSLGFPPSFSMHDIRETYMEWSLNRVEYISDATIATTDSVEALMRSKSHWNNRSISLLKRGRYRTQRELRFVFDFVHPRLGIVAPKIQYIDIKLQVAEGHLPVALTFEH